MSIPVLPASAPFTPEQRAWLNGFFASIFGMDSSLNSSGASNGAYSNGTLPPGAVAFDAASLNRVGSDSGGNDRIPVPAGSPAALNGVGPAVAEPQESDEMPWHDPALAIDERMALAEGRPLPRRLMAAMAQLDCGQCGYLCQSYAQAIAEGDEKSLKKCVPGGKETAQKLKAIMAG